MNEDSIKVLESNKEMILDIMETLRDFNTNLAEIIEILTTSETVEIKITIQKI